jgi:hypothetical protein
MGRHSTQQTRDEYAFDENDVAGHYASVHTTRSTRIECIRSTFESLPSAAADSKSAADRSCCRWRFSLRRGMESSDSSDSLAVRNTPSAFSCRRQ